MKKLKVIDIIYRSLINSVEWNSELYSAVQGGDDKEYPDKVKSEIYATMDYFEKRFKRKHPCRYDFEALLKRIEDKKKEDSRWIK